MSRSPTVKQRALVRGIVSGKSQTQAAIDAGYSERSAYSVGSETLKKPEVRELMQRALRRKGISEDRLAEVLDEGLRANRVISAVVGTDATGKTMDFIDVPDHATRHKFLDSAIELLDFKPEKQTAVNVLNVMLSNLGAASESEVRYAMEMLKRAGAMDLREKVRSCVQFLVDATRADDTLRAELQPLLSQAEVMRDGETP